MTDDDRGCRAGNAGHAVMFGQPESFVPPALGVPGKIQLSPSNGGGTGFYNQSFRDYFYDLGYAWDPVPGTTVTSKNGVSSQP